MAWEAYEMFVDSENLLILQNLMEIIKYFLEATTSQRRNEGTWCLEKN